MFYHILVKCTDMPQLNFVRRTGYIIHSYGLWSVVHQSYFTLIALRLEGGSVDPDEAAHNEPPHLDLHCFQV